MRLKIVKEERVLVFCKLSFLRKITADYNFQKKLKRAPSFFFKKADEGPHKFLSFSVKQIIGLPIVLEIGCFEIFSANFVLKFTKFAFKNL